MRLLVIEDDDEIAEPMVRGLERAGFEVHRVATGADALAADPADVVLLDLGLPDIDGLDVCRRLRETSPIPILVVTARDEEADRVTGLELGADDYIPKPFSPRELAARIKAVLRRTESQADADEVIELGDVVLDRGGREVTVAGEPVELTSKEFDLLACLIENGGIVCSRDQLLDRVWGMSYPGGTRTVDVHVAQLRRKLGRPDLIRTVRGSGYKAVKP